MAELMLTIEETDRQRSMNFVEALDRRNIECSMNEDESLFEEDQEYSFDFQVESKELDIVVQVENKLISNIRHY